MWAGEVEEEDRLERAVVQAWRFEEEAHYPDWGDVMDHLQMLKALDQNLLEALEVPQQEMKVR